MKAKHDFTYRKEKVRIACYSASDFMYRCIQHTDTFYEIDLLQYIRFALKDRPGLVMDVGANIGNHSVFFGKFMKRSVICFEPNPVLHAILEQNLQVNGVTYRLYPIGLGEREGQFIVDSRHEGAVHNIGGAKLQESSQGTIAVRPLDAYLTQFQRDRIAAIKADIEGMEPAMLRGARSFLERHKPDLFLETIDAACLKQIEDILRPMGYVGIASHGECPPVWHFSHRSHLALYQRLRLRSYVFGRSVVHFLATSKLTKIPRKLFRSIKKRIV